MPPNKKKNRDDPPTGTGVAMVTAVQSAHLTYAAKHERGSKSQQRLRLCGLQLDPFTQIESVGCPEMLA